MCHALKSGGRLYLCFPCEESVGFPSRKGTLRFSDDPTHSAPPAWHETLETVRQCGMKVIFQRKRYRPVVAFVLGFLLEPFSIVLKRGMPLASTWALWGFESVIWAEKR